MDVCSIAIIAKRTGLFPGPGSYELLENCSIDECSDGGSMPAGACPRPRAIDAECFREEYKNLGMGAPRIANECEWVG